MPDDDAAIPTPPVADTSAGKWWQQDQPVAHADNPAPAAPKATGWDQFPNIDPAPKLTINDFPLATPQDIDRLAKQQQQAAPKLNRGARNAYVSDIVGSVGLLGRRPNEVAMSTLSNEITQVPTEDLQTLIAKHGKARKEVRDLLSSELATRPPVGFEWPRGDRTQRPLRVIKDFNFRARGPSDRMPGPGEQFIDADTLDVFQLGEHGQINLVPAKSHVQGPAGKADLNELVKANPLAATEDVSLPGNYRLAAAVLAEAQGREQDQATQLVRGLVKKLPVARSVFGTLENRDYSRALDAVATGKATTNDYRVAARAVVDGTDEQKKSVLRQIGDGISILPAFIFDLWLTGGVAGAGGKAAQGLAATAGAGRFGQTAAQFAGAAAAQSAVQPALAENIAATQVPKIQQVDDDTGLAKFAIQQVGIGPVEAVLRGYGDTLAEVGSERAGEVIWKALGAAGAKLAPQSAAALGRAFTRFRATYPGASASQFVQHIQDPGTEFLEERLGENVAGVLGTGDFGMTGALARGDLAQAGRQAVVEAGVLGPVGGIAMAARAPTVLPAIQATREQAQRLSEAQQFKTSPEREQARAERAEFFTPEVVSAVVDQYRARGQDKALAELASKAEPDRADWSAAGLPEELGRSGEARKQFVTNLRPLLAGDAANVFSAQPEKPQTRPEPIERPERLADAPIAPEPREKPTGPIAPERPKTPQEQLAARYQEIGVPATIGELMQSGATFVTTENGFKHTVKAVRDDGSIVTKQGRILPFQPIAEGKWQVSHRAALKGSSKYKPAAATSESTSTPAPSVIPQPVADSAEPQSGSPPAKAERLPVQAAAGRETTIEAAGMKPFVGRYAVVDLEDIQASHDFATGSPKDNLSYPRGLQPRSYRPGSANAAKVRTHAQQKKAGYFVSSHPDATSGPPVIDQSGTVINGNGRAMTLQLSASKGDFGWYRAELSKEAERYGISRDEVERRKHPVLVRIVDTPADSPEAADFARAGNQVTTQQESPARAAAQLGYLVDSASLDDLNIPEDTTPSEFIAKGGGKRFAEQIRKALPDNLRPNYFTDEGSLTGAGRDLVRNLMLTRVLPLPLVEKLTDRFDSLKSMVEGAVPQLLKLQAEHGESNATPQIVEAVSFLAGHPDVKTIGHAEDALSQQSLFGGKSSIISPGGRMMLDYILSLRSPVGTYKATEFRRGLAHLIKEVGTSRGGLFGERSEPADIAADVLGVEKRDGAEFGGRKQLAGVADYSGGTTEVPVSMEPTGPPLSEHDVIATIAHDFGVPIRADHTGRPRRVAGIYKQRARIIRTRGKFEGNLAVIAHETGHHIDQTTNILNKLPAELKEELKLLDYDQKQKRVFEGFAEFIRHYWTTDQASTLAPKFSRYFEQWLKNSPDLAAKMAKARALITRWRTQGAHARRLAQTQAPGWRPRILGRSAVEAIKEGGQALVNRIWFEGMDRFNPVHQAVSDAKKQGYTSGDDVDAGELIAAYNQAAPGHAERALLEGFHTVSKDHRQLGTGLKDVFDSLKSGEYDEWASYHLFRHALDVFQKTPNYNPGFLKDDAEYFVAKIKADPEKLARFEHVSKALVKFNDDRLEMLLDAGVLTPVEVERMRAAWGQTYTSLRRIKSNGLLSRITSSLLGTKNPIRRRSAEGSGLPVMDPVESTILNTLEAYDAALKQQVWKSLYSMAKQTDAMGKYMDEVPPTKRATIGNTEEIAKALEEAGFDPDLIREAGMVARLRRVVEDRSKSARDELRRTEIDWIVGRYGITLQKPGELTDAEIEQVIEQADERGVPDLETQISLWRPDYSPNKNEHIIRIVLNGQPHLLQITDESLWQALEGMSPLQLPWFLSAFGEMTKIKKLGATGLSTTFAVGQVSADYLAYLVQTKERAGLDAFWGPLASAVWYARDELPRIAGEATATVPGMERFAGKVQEFVDKALGVADPATRLVFGDLREAVKLWSESGTVATRLGADSSRLKNVRGELTGKYGVDLLTRAERGVQALRDVVGLVDGAPRISEFTAYLRNRGWILKGGQWHNKSTGETGRPPRALVIRATLAARDVTTDFTRAGRTGRVLDRSFFAFLNANVQSQAKFARTVGEILTGKENATHRAVMLATMLSTALVYVLHRLEDDDYLEQEDWLRNRFWTYGDGEQTWFRVRKPFDWAVVSNLVEATVRRVKKGDKEAIPHVVAAELENRNPLSLPTAIGPLLEAAMDYSYFRNGPIEGDALKRLEPAQRAHAHTSPAAKFIGAYTGKIVGWGPAKVDYVLGEMSGGLWQRTIGARSVESVVGKWSGASAVALDRDYFDSLDDFYKVRRTARMRVDTAKHVGVKDTEAEARAHELDKFESLMTDIREPVRGETDREKRFAIERYAIGIARHALGKEELASYPNPLRSNDLPAPVQVVVDDFIGRALMVLTLPDGERQHHQSLAEWKQAQEERREQIAEAKALLSQSGLSSEGMKTLLKTTMRRRGSNPNSFASRARIARFAKKMASQ